MADEKSTFKKELSYEGIPFRGNPMPVGQSQDARPVLGYESRSEVLDTSQDPDREKLADIYTKARKHISYIEFIEKEYMPEKGHWRVFVTWTDKFYHNGADNGNHQ